MLKRETVLVPRLAVVLNCVANLVVRSSVFSLLPGRTFLFSWNDTCAPTAAGVTVPYRRTSPLWLERLTFSVTRYAAWTVTIELYRGRGSSVLMRYCVLLLRCETWKLKPPAASVTVGVPA